MEYYTVKLLRVHLYHWFVVLTKKMKICHNFNNTDEILQQYRLNINDFYQRIHVCMLLQIYYEI